mmetsp:Transcript_1491/g.4738  ORF Transcript_1491/g.4738 Transcript_1491/m.4738 type:complete len:379 (+) Transcript_1491:1360-2496(+)
MRRVALHARAVPLLGPPLGPASLVARHVRPLVAALRAADHARVDACAELGGARVHRAQVEPEGEPAEEGEARAERHQLRDELDERADEGDAQLVLLLERPQPNRQRHAPLSTVDRIDLLRPHRPADGGRDVLELEAARVRVVDRVLVDGRDESKRHLGRAGATQQRVGRRADGGAQRGASVDGLAARPSDRGLPRDLVRKREAAREVEADLRLGRLDVALCATVRDGARAVARAGGALERARHVCTVGRESHSKRGHRDAGGAGARLARRRVRQDALFRRVAEGGEPRVKGRGGDRVVLRGGGDERGRSVLVEKQELQDEGQREGGVEEGVRDGEEPARARVAWPARDGRHVCTSQHELGHAGAVERSQPEHDDKGEE